MKLPRRYRSFAGLAVAVTAIAIALGVGYPSDRPNNPSAFLSTYLSPIAAQAQTLAQSNQSSNQSANQPVNWATIEQNIITEHNRIRQNPQSYIPILEAYLARMNAQGNIPNGCGQNCTLTTNEGKPAVEEAIRFLRNQPAVGALTLSDNVARAAKAHAQDQQGGEVGHTSSDGSSLSQRLTRFGVQPLSAGENIDYGSTTAQGVIISLIVDDGVPSRGHRTNLFSPNWTIAGAGCGSHAVYRTVCVIDYAKGSQATAANNRLSVINNGTVDLLSIKIAERELLNGAVARGQSQNVTLSANQSCTANLTIQLGGNYSRLNWNNLDLCGATITIDSRNQLSLRYPTSS
ncbi:MAG: hypothetical protein DCF15_06240 [Phormidesmis priestleyi]|uniref:SCP domain-containing protein n=1 Tax=Phormidesmis priestleyi TaxID=268141 RepID=A0A2W4ZI48_9CYAN|nr:MAG: hypothetical protein DCF15_06240 [Phormidesmis priestleyi]